MALLCSFFKAKYHQILQGHISAQQNSIKWHLVNEGNYTLDRFLIIQVGNARITEH